MKKLFLTLLILGVVGGGVAWYFDLLPKTEAKTGGLAAVDMFKSLRGDLLISITENGTLVAKESMKVVPKFRREGKITFLIEEGAEVKEGDVVCKVDATELQNQIEQTELEIVQSEANLNTAKTELEIQKAENAANVEKAAAAVEKSEKELEKYRDGESPQERRKLEISIKDAETEYNRAEKRFQDSSILLERNFIKKAELEDHAIAFEKAKVQKESAETALVLFDKYTFPLTLKDHETKVRDTKRELDNAEKRAISTLGQKDVAVQQADKRLKMQKKNLSDRKEELENMTLKAPCPGIVIYGDPHEPWYRENLKVGGTIWGGNTVITIPDLRVMQVKMKVHEADINKVKSGQKVRVTMDSYAGMILEGEVSKIASVAGGDNPWEGSSAEVKKFDVDVTIKDTADLRLKPGISAKAEIHIDKRDGALYVPLQCVFIENGEHFCYVGTTTTPPERRKLKVGQNNENFIEILEGLESGEMVALHNPNLPIGASEEKKPEEPASSGTPSGEAGAAGASPEAGVNQ